MFLKEIFEEDFFDKKSADDNTSTKNYPFTHHARLKLETVSKCDWAWHENLCNTAVHKYIDLNYHQFINFSLSA